MINKTVCYQNIYCGRPLGIISSINCFITSCRTSSKERISGTFRTIKINAQKSQLIQNAQNHAESFKVLESQKQTFNFQRNSTGLYECRGSIQGYYPLYIPRGSRLAENIVEDLHIKTLQGGAYLTMTKVRRQYW